MPSYDQLQTNNACKRDDAGKLRDLSGVPAGDTSDAYVNRGFRENAKIVEC